MQFDHQVVQLTPQVSQGYIQNVGETEKKASEKIGWKKVQDHNFQWKSSLLSDSADNKYSGQNIKDNLPSCVTFYFSVHKERMEN